MDTQQLRRKHSPPPPNGRDGEAAPNRKKRGRLPKYEEVCKIRLDLLSEADLARRKRQMGEIEIDETVPIRPAIASDMEASLSVRQLNSDFTCAICLGILQETMTVMECLHRYCRDCIEMSIRMGRKQCPSCRIKVATRRNLRRDEAFDLLIRQIYPDICQAVEDQEREADQLIQGHNVEAYVASVEQGQQKQDINRRTRVAISRPSMEIKSKHLGEVSEQIVFSLTPLKCEMKKLMLPKLCKRFLKCSRAATIAQLKSYLSLKLKHDGPFEISMIPADSKTRTVECLPNNLNLNKVDKKNGGQKMVELLYCLSAAASPIETTQNSAGGDAKQVDAGSQNR
eukprot:CAMPEP_0114502448 /NCGR_PEP_ID=MMETSP0109-20121206/9099_1 /TAXON_ID=29199 /ORGANISM="Chlorarachnion reptans, Strain CCCM449" /LENGTH=340 /DNA_ID=CAMNT_0001680369 /DNA_START=59 /DNA_END=1081 /DNA_ORIENTATION=-